MTTNPDLVESTTSAFREAVGCAPDIVAFAPGRVNLIGEHTDYNDGFALPCALSFGTAVAMGARSDNRIQARALDLGNRAADFSTEGQIARLEDGNWENHIRGVTAGMPRFGLPVGGANLVILGDIPQGAGLSSSASLGVATALGLAALAGDTAPDPLAIARVAQWSEHHYVGCACGLMDQLASAVGVNGKALLIDCRTLTSSPVDFPSGTAIMIVHSGVTRGLVDSAYNKRREQCAVAATHYGVTALRDVNRAMLEAQRGNLDDTVYRRARHVVTENDRTLLAAEALAAGDLVSLGTAMRGSHTSLRDDFEVSVPAIDALVECLNHVIGPEGGARMTGGGFGGCVVAVLPESKVEAVKAALSGYWARHDMAAQMSLVVAPKQGAHLIRN